MDGFVCVRAEESVIPAVVGDKQEQRIVDGIVHVSLTHLQIHIQTNTNEREREKNNNERWGENAMEMQQVSEWARETCGSGCGKVRQCCQNCY